MCKAIKTPVILQPKSVEELVAEKSIGMTDEQKAQYWYELSQSIFALLGKVEVDVYEISADEWYEVARAEYQTLMNVKLADSKFYTTDLVGIMLILTRDWSNLVPFIPDVSDCDKFCTRLYNHLVDYYGLTAVVPVWGDTDPGYHGFNLGVFRAGTGWIARLIEPQSDAVFERIGPLGTYVPREVAQELGTLKYPLVVGGGVNV